MKTSTIVILSLISDLSLATTKVINSVTTERYSALRAQDGNTYVGDGVTLITNGSGVESNVIGVYGNSDVELKNSKIIANGDDAYGIFVSGQQGFPDTTINIDSSSITTKSAALILQDHVTGSISDSTITVARDDSKQLSQDSFGIHAIDYSTINVKNVSITTSGKGANALVSTSSSNINIENTQNESLTTESDSSHGIYSRYKSNVNIDGSGNGSLTIKTSGNNSYGILAWDHGNVLANKNSNLSVNTTGYGSFGVLSYYDSSVSLNDASITTSGTLAHGVYVYDGSSISINNGSIHVSGENASAIYARSDQNYTDDDNVINISNSNIVSDKSNLIRVNGANLTVTLDTVNAYTGNGYLLNVSGENQNSKLKASSVDLTISNSSLDGNIIVDSGNTADVNLTNNSTLTGNSQNTTNLNIDNSSSWYVTGNSTVSNTVTNGGLISFTSPEQGGFKTLETGSYVGNSGTLNINTVLGDDSSSTDKLIVDGSATGKTYVKVTNAGGTGAKTNEGILVIETGSSASDTFVQSGRIVAGSYDYQLQQGTSSGKNTNNWYLTSKNSYRPESGTYSSNLAAANTLFSMTLHDRLGETQYTDALTGEQKVTSMWMRAVGGRNSYDMQDSQNHTTANRYVFQLGSDIAQWSSDGLDRYHVGVMGGYANQHSNTRNNQTGYNSKGIVDGYSAGLYGTWYANDKDKTGLYVDTWALYNWFNNEVKGNDLPSEKYKSNGMTASVETGYTFHPGSYTTAGGMVNNFYIQPQAQATWMGVEADDHTESNGTKVSGKGDNNVQTRLGVRFFLNGKSHIDKGTEREFEPFIETNWIHNTKDYGTTMNGESDHISGTRNMGEVKVGVEGKVTNNVNLWGNVAQRMGDNGYNDTQGLVGVKYMFK